MKNNFVCYNPWLSLKVIFFSIFLTILWTIFQSFNRRGDGSSQPLIEKPFTHKCVSNQLIWCECHYSQFQNEIVQWMKERKAKFPCQLVLDEISFDPWVDNLGTSIVQKDEEWLRIGCLWRRLSLGSSSFFSFTMWLCSGSLVFTLLHVRLNLDGSITLRHNFSSV